MTTRLFSNMLKGRPKAAFLHVRAWLALFVCILLIGCSTLGNTLVENAERVLPGGAKLGEQAAQLSAASLTLRVRGFGEGLLLLRESAHGLTFWQAGGGETVVLRGGYLESTSKISPDLRMTVLASQTGQNEVPPWQRPAGSSPVEYDIVRSWIDRQGRVDSGRARVRLLCQADTEQVTLPLTTRALQRCDETLAWARGATTSSVFWREPESPHHVWAAHVVPWPDSPVFEWQVARPWW